MKSAKQRHDPRTAAKIASQKLKSEKFALSLSETAKASTQVAKDLLSLEWAALNLIRVSRTVWRIK